MNFKSWKMSSERFSLELSYSMVENTVVVIHGGYLALINMNHAFCPVLYMWSLLSFVQFPFSFL